MKKVIALVVVLGALGCHEVVRDEATYRAEVTFMTTAAMQEAASLVMMVKSYCRCTNGKFTTPECDIAARRALVIQTRIPWHKDMMLYNARLSEERPPSDPPTVPQAASLCP